MKFLEFHSRITKIVKFHFFPFQNHENHRIIRIPLKNHENHENVIIPFQDKENHKKKIIIPRQNYENLKVLTIIC